VPGEIHIQGTVAARRPRSGGRLHACRTQGRFGSAQVFGQFLGPLPFLLGPVVLLHGPQAFLHGPQAFLLGAFGVLSEDSQPCLSLAAGGNGTAERVEQTHCAA
jgi:hypothetical protein